MFKAHLNYKIISIVEYNIFFLKKENILFDLLLFYNSRKDAVEQKSKNFNVYYKIFIKIKFI